AHEWINSLDRDVALFLGDSEFEHSLFVYHLDEIAKTYNALSKAAVWLTTAKERKLSGDDMIAYEKKIREAVPSADVPSNQSSILKCVVGICGDEAAA